MHDLIHLRWTIYKVSARAARGKLLSNAFALWRSLSSPPIGNNVGVYEKEQPAER